MLHPGADVDDNSSWSAGRRIHVAIGLFGAALLYGDGIIAPEIMLLSALKSVTSQLMCSSL